MSKVGHQLDDRVAPVNASAEMILCGPNWLPWPASRDRLINAVLDGAGGADEITTLRALALAEARADSTATAGLNSGLRRAVTERLAELYAPERLLIALPRRRPGHARNRSNGVANGANDVANAVRTRIDVPHPVSAAHGVTRCPHCRHELAVIAVVIPADAAHVPTPEVIT